MKLKVLAIALLLPSMGAFASNTVTFTGEVAKSTCSVTVDGTQGNVYVQLPTVQLTELSSGNGTGGQTFTFNVSGCSSPAGENAASTAVGIRLVPTINDVTAAGNLSNTSSGTKAANVSIQILDGGLTGTPVNFSQGEQSGSTQPLPTGSTDSLTFTYGARYFAEGTPGPGKVESQLQYALTYK